MKKKISRSFGLLITLLTLWYLLMGQFMTLRMTLFLSYSDRNGDNNGGGGGNGDDDAHDSSLYLQPKEESSLRLRPSREKPTPGRHPSQQQQQSKSQGFVKIKNESDRKTRSSTSSSGKGRLGTDKNQTFHNKDQQTGIVNDTLPYWFERLVMATTNRSVISLGFERGSIELPSTDAAAASAASSSFLLDAMYWNRLPRIYPGRFTWPSSSDGGGGGYVLAQWSLPTRLAHTVTPTGNSDGGGDREATILGNDWIQTDTARRGPSSSSFAPRVGSLLYIPILKNAHTTLTSAMGNLRQHILNCTISIRGPPRKNPTSQDETTRQRNERQQKEFDSAIGATTNTKNQEHADDKLIFTLLRDPVDRYISGICEELRPSGMGMVVRKECFSPTSNTATSSSSLIQQQRTHLDCLLRELMASIVSFPDQPNVHFLPHIRPQAMLLSESLSSRHADVGVSVVGWSDLSQLLRELGHGAPSPDESSRAAAGTASNQNIRDRQNANYYIGRRERRTPMLPSAAVPKRAAIADKAAALQATLQHQQPTQGGRTGRRLTSADTAAASMKDLRSYRLRESRRESFSKREKAKELQMEQLSQFCKMRPSDMNPLHLRILCKIYEMDVALLRAVGIPVASCDGFHDGGGG